MATKKDLTEAYAFSRRRLVTAFVSGAPGGREVEPARPGRTIVGGLALSVLLIAGAAVAGVFSPRVDEGWADQPGLIVSEDSGAAYVITEVEEGEEPVLRPVINITSARLILGPDVEPTIIPDEYISQEQPGDDIGILGAPANVPSPDRLVDDGWTACLAPDAGLRVQVGEDPAVSPATGGGLLVSVAGEPGDDVYVVAQARAELTGEGWFHSYRVPPSDGRDNLLGAVGLPAAESATVVPEDWLALFPEGGDLTRQAFGLDAPGTPAEYAAGEPGLEDAEVGDVVATPQETLLLTDRAPVLLDEFAAAVYLNSGEATVIEQDAAPTLTRDPEPYLQAEWPDGPVAPVPGELCAQLVTEADARPGVRLVQGPGEDASGAEVAPGRREVSVAEGGGAYVLSGSWEQAGDGLPHLIDAKGLRYPLVGPDTADRLGYGDHPVVTVPDSWVELFEKGVALSENAALCPPTTKPDGSCG